MNPGPRSQCGLCKKYCKASDRLIECEKCEKSFHTSCSNLGDDELLRIESGDGAWSCTNCKSDCGLCSGSVLKGHKVKKISNDQELIQSDPISCPQNQKGNNLIHKLTTVYERHSRQTE